VESESDMGQSELPPTTNNGQMHSVSLSDYLLVLARHKRFIVRSVIGTGIIAALLLFLVVSRWYKSTAIVMPPKETNALSVVTALSRATAPLRSLGLGSASQELSNFETILASRRVTEAVVTRFDLKTAYGEKLMEKACRELEDNVTVSQGKQDVSIEIGVFDTDPIRAADMANYFVEMLNRVNLEMNVAEAKGNREFLETRYQQNLRDLKNAEESFKTFQEQTGVYSVPDQVKAAVGAAASLESRIALKKVQLGILEQTTTPENSVRQETELELEELQKQLTALQYGSNDPKSRSLVFPPFRKAPEIGIEYIRHYREVELQSKLLELLLPLYEQAKIEEHRSTPAVIVLDTAVPAERPSKPKRTVILFAIVVASFIVAYFIALYKESMRNTRSERSEEQEEKMRFIRKELALRNILR